MYDAVHDHIMYQRFLYYAQANTIPLKMTIKFKQNTRELRDSIYA